jgi:hypothetical protein
VKGHPLWPGIEWKWSPSAVGVGGFVVPKSASKQAKYFMFFGNDDIAW